MAGYAKPDALVETDWLEEHVKDPGIRVIEVDEDTEAYEKGHIDGAVGWNWSTDLHAEVGRDYVDQAESLRAPLGGGCRHRHHRDPLRREQQLVRGVRVLGAQAPWVRQRVIYAQEPVDHVALVARVRSMLRIKEQQDTIQAQATQLEVYAAELAADNRQLSVQLAEEAKLAEIARLLGDIGHDVKNMMMPIVMGADLLDCELKELLKRFAGDDENRSKATEELSQEVFGMVRSNSRRIQDRVKEIADAVKGRSGPASFAACQISTLISAVFSTLRYFAEQNGVRLSAGNLDDLPVLNADENRLFNVFYDLINNAIPETPRGGSITVDGRFDSETEVLTLSVKDTGRGMPREVQTAFSPNVQSVERQEVQAWGPRL